MQATDEFKDKATARNQMWQTDFIYLKVMVQIFDSWARIVP